MSAQIIDFLAAQRARCHGCWTEEGCADHVCSREDDGLCYAYCDRCEAESQRRVEGIPTPW